MDPMGEQLTSLRRELRELMGSWEYAFAMGHGCSMGFLPTESQAVLRHAEVLRAKIGELSG